MVSISSARMLGGRHRLDVLDLQRGESSFELSYTISPPIPAEAPGGGMVIPVLSGVDDRGNVYVDAGGGFTTTPDGTATTGTISAAPAIVPEARSVAVRFQLMTPSTEEGHDFVVDLPEVVE